MNTGCLMPIWIYVLQALTTPIIATLVAIIGFLQWRTAHQRAVLDLFERRMAVYDSLEEVVSEIIRGGNVTNARIRDFDHAIGKAPFLFAKEVISYLEELRNALSSHHALNGHEDDRSVEASAKYFTKIGRFYDEFGVLLSPYMRMHQKAPWF